METLIVNFDTKKVRHDKLEGREYLVCPTVILTEGVHNGSQGKLYYPEKELKKTPVVWNHKPIVVYHPEMNGKAISACEPAVMESRKVGIMLTTNYDDKLRTEAWLEKDKLDKVDPRIRIAIDRGEMVEVSTGLFTDNIQTPGEWKGEKYDAVATNYRPDHLAILPDKKGACSIADGAGLLQTNEEKKEDKDKYLKLQEEAIKSFPTDKRDVIVVTNGKMEMVMNAMSHQDIASGITHTMTGQSSDKYGYWPGYVADVYDSFFVYSQDNQYYKQDYSIDGEYKIALNGKSVEVMKYKEYRTKDGTHVAVTGRDVSNSRMSHNQGDNTVPEPITPPVPVAPATNVVATPPVVVPSVPAIPIVPPKEMTTEQYLANASPELREVLQEGIAMRNMERKRLIDCIVANKANIYTAEQLAFKPLFDLQALATLAAPAPVANQLTLPRPGFWGAGGVAPVQITNNNAGPEQEALSIPVMNFAPIAK